MIIDKIRDIKITKNRAIKSINNHALDQNLKSDMEKDILLVINTTNMIIVRHNKMKEDKADLESKSLINRYNIFTFL